MPLPVDVDTVTHSVQLAVAPVFFLTAVAGMIGAVAGRLARIIDRARTLEERVRTATDPAATGRHLQELGTLRTRGRIANASIGFLALCGVMIGCTIVALFLGQTGGASWPRIAVACFLTGVGSFLVALLGFLWETVLATQLLNFKVLEMDREFRG
jgi:formate-dependent nitrite reductase membrane component NrfD